MFKSGRALSLHLALSPACEQFANQRDLKRNASMLALVEANVVVRSTKRPAILRRNQVNDSFPITYNAVVNDSGVANKDCNDFISSHAAYEDDPELFAANDTGFENANDNVTNLQVEPTIDAVPLMYTNDQKWTVALLKLLDDMNAPDYAFEAIIKWARGANNDNYSFHPQGGLSRSNNVDILFSSMQNAKKLLPNVQTVHVPHGPPCDVITYDFVPQLLSLLQNRKIMMQENLVIDMNNPLQQYHSPDGKIGEALSGSVYRDAYSTLVQFPDRQLFVPIIQWIDRTSVTGNDRFSLKPYMFTPAIFTENFRRTIQAWGYHGFLPKPKTSSAQNQIKQTGDNNRNYHAQLTVVLQSFQSANERLKNVTLPIGATGQMTVDVITCILFIIQDMQEGDMLCGRYGPHTPRVQRHSRACTVNFDNLDNLDDRCRYLLAGRMAQVASGPNSALRTRWSQHQMTNAFDSIPLADPVRGIFGATPVETMHAYRKGIIEKVTFLVLENIPASKKADLDYLAVRFHKTHRQTYRKAYPATDFSNGITNLTRISASERLGLVFLFVILAHYDEGWELFETALDKHTSCTFRDVLNLWECMLCFDSWLNRSTFWKIESSDTEKPAFQDSIIAFLQMCKERIPTVTVKKIKKRETKKKSGKTINKAKKLKRDVPREDDGDVNTSKARKPRKGDPPKDDETVEVKEKTWKFPKFHELLHIVDDIERFGAPMNYCAQRPESLLIPVAKQPGRRAQKRHEGSVYELQAAQRLSYSIIIDAMYSRLWNTDVTGKRSFSQPDVPPVAPKNTGRATFATVTRVNSSDENLKADSVITWKSATNIERMGKPQALMTFLLERFGSPVRFCTEYVHAKHTYRCHPCYQSDGPIYDWMKASFEGIVYPCRLAAVVVCDKDHTEQWHLVVQRATKKTNVRSVLLTEWWWSPTYYAISPNAIVAPCFVISIKEDNSKILETLPIDEWYLNF